MKFLAVAAGLVAAVSAYTYPVPFNPTADGTNAGNPIYTPDTTSPVTLNEAYDITWDPTTPGPVALVLCKGPSSNCVPIMTIAEKISNSGKFSWTPSGLTPSATSSGGYGIMLIDWTNKDYQWSTQFGVLEGSVSSVSSSASSTTLSTKTSTSTVHIVPSGSSAVVSPTTKVSMTSPAAVTSMVVSTTVVCPESSSMPMGTGTVSMAWTTTTAPSVPTSVSSGAPTQPAYTQVGAAPRNVMSYGAMGAAAGLAALLAF